VAFVVVIIVTMKNTVLGDVKPFSLVDIYQTKLCYIPEDSILKLGGFQRMFMLVLLTGCKQQEFENDSFSNSCMCIVATDKHALLFVEECVDMRKGQCFLEYSDGGCTNPMMHEQTRMICCCSMGHAWGTPCQECPRPDSSK